MRHIRLLHSNTPLCENPEDIGKDFVVTDMGPETICTKCSALLFTHNEKAFEGEMAASVKRSNLLMENNPLAPARGCVYGLLISSAFWILLIVSFYLAFFRG